MNPDLPVVAVEAAIRWGWDGLIGLQGGFVGMEGFGASAPAEALYEHFGITADAVVEQALVRCSKKAGRQTFGQPRKGLYSFGKDYVCSVSAARDSLNVYLENNPRYPVKYVLV